jgi:hypothetical protein
MYSGPVGGHMRQLILAGQMANWIFEHPDGVTFTELIDQFPEAIGEHTLALGDMPNVVLWSKLSFVARAAMASLINDGYIRAQVVPETRYRKGSGPQLSTLSAVPRSNPAAPIWCPVAWFAIPSAFEDDAV